MNVTFLRLKFFIVMIAVSLGSIAQVYAEQPVTEPIKIGVVNTEKILRESIPALDAQHRIDEEFIPRDTKIKDMAKQAKVLQDKLEKEGVTMSDTGRRKLERELANLSRDYQRAQRQMREDLTVRQNEEYSVILNLVDKAIEFIAKKERYDLILQLQDSVYRSQRIDITDQVIEVLDVEKQPMNKP